MPPAASSAPSFLRQADAVDFHFRRRRSANSVPNLRFSYFFPLFRRRECRSPSLPSFTIFHDPPELTASIILVDAVIDPLCAL